MVNNPVELCLVTNEVGCSFIKLNLRSVLFSLSYEKVVEYVAKFPGVSLKTNALRGGGLCKG